VHHGIRDLGWLAAHRLHPLERLFSKTVSRLPFWFLGFSFKALVLHQTIYKAQTLLEHTIFRRDFGPLKWVFATPGHHHRHHANERDCRDHSFAARLSEIDTIGGTLFLPKNRKPQGYGPKMAVPRLYHQQRVYPFQWAIDRQRQRFARKPTVALPAADDDLHPSSPGTGPTPP
jgi:sterol desaturase/sphingolipid hydroxylase (fatty acid hydroxylase superfamily)